MISIFLVPYRTFDCFFKKLDHAVLPTIMQTQILSLATKSIIDASFISLDSTPVFTNTSLNNPKSFLSDKFNPDNQPKTDKDYKLGVHTASNQLNEKKYKFYWGYKNHVLADCISGLPIYEITSTTEAADSSVALDILAHTHAFFPISECTFFADKSYDVKNIYNRGKEFYDGEYILLVTSWAKAQIFSLFTFLKIQFATFYINAHCPSHPFGKYCIRTIAVYQKPHYRDICRNL